MWTNLVRKLQNRWGQKPETWQQEIIARTGSFTMTSDVNILALIKAIRHVVENKVEGAVVECGVWKGGSMMAAVHTLLHLKDTERQVYLYDTYEQFSVPAHEDVSYKGEKGSAVLQKLATDGKGWLAPTIEEVRNNLDQTGYPAKHIHLIKGEVEKTIPETMPGKIALLRLDTDWYASTKHELTWLFPRLSKGGVLIIDDYGYWKGCKKAVDEYFENHKIKPQLIRIDFSARMMYKA